jgi:hypothetical protein
VSNHPEQDTYCRTDELHELLGELPGGGVDG